MSYSGAIKTATSKGVKERTDQRRYVGPIISKNASARGDSKKDRAAPKPVGTGSAYKAMASSVRMGVLRTMNIIPQFSSGKIEIDLKASGATLIPEDFGETRTLTLGRGTSTLKVIELEVLHIVKETFPLGESLTASAGGRYAEEFDQPRHHIIVPPSSMARVITLPAAVVGQEASLNRDFKIKPVEGANVLFTNEGRSVLYTDYKERIGPHYYENGDLIVGMWQEGIDFRFDDRLVRASEHFGRDIYIVDRVTIEREDTTPYYVWMASVILPSDPPAVFELTASLSPGGYSAVRIA